MTTYNWTITNLYTKTVEGLEDYVVTAVFEVEGLDGEFSCIVNGSQVFTVKEGAEFIPYANLTEAIVVEWIKEELGEEGLAPIYSHIEENIENQKSPAVEPVITPLPWA
jgi:hypothetical protein